MPTIKEIRESQGLTQPELAEKAGISTPAISRMERGIPVNKSTLILACRALGVNPSDVTGVNVVNRVAKRYHK